MGHKKLKPKHLLLLMSAALASTANRADEIHDRLIALAPLVDGAILNESYIMQQQVFGHATERMDRISFWRHYATHFHSLGGISSGDCEVLNTGPSSIWTKLFTYRSHQNEHSNVGAYKDKIQGVVAGHDWTLTTNFLLGAAASFSHFKVHHDGSSHTSTKTNSFQGLIYTSYYFNSPFFINGLGGIAYNTYDVQREIFLDDFTLIPSGERSAWQTSLQVEGGYVFEKANRHIIPQLSLFYSHLKFTGFDEIGAGNANQSILKSKAKTFLIGLGLRYVYDFVCGRCLLQPDVHGYFYYDLQHERMEVDSQFIGSEPRFITAGSKPERITLNVGSSATLFNVSGFSFMADLDLNFKAHYYAWGGYLRGRYELL